MKVKINDIKLTKEQIKFYDDSGYLIVPGVLDGGMCEKIKDFAAGLAEGDHSVLLNIHRKEDVFMQIVKSPIIVGIIKQVQKNKVVAMNDQYLYKKAGTPYAKQSWNPHQDSAYVNAKKETYMQIHFFLDAQEKENGGLYCFPGSHEEEILPYTYAKSWREEFDENGISHPGWKVEVPPQYKQLDVVAPQGAIFLQHGNVIHGSHPNMSKNRSRQQYSIAYLNEGETIDKGEASIKIPVQVE